MRTMRILLATAAIMASAGSTASAEQFCNHRFVHGDEITVTRYGSTSCSLARSGAKRVIDLGYAPPSVLAHSAVTGLNYRMYRIKHAEDSSFFTATYRGFGKGTTRIGFRLTIRKL